MKNKTKLNIHKLIDNVNQNNTGIYNRSPELIARLPIKISRIIGSKDVYISEFIIAKIKGKINELDGHPEISDEILERLPKSLSRPYKIYEDNRTPNRDKYIFINMDPAHQIVVEIHRPESGKTEINTIIPLNSKKRKQLEKNLKAVFTSAGGATNPSSSLSQQDRLSGVNTI